MGKRGVGGWATGSVLATVLLAVLMLWVPAAAQAGGGGGTIATAPELPIGTTVVGGANKVNDREFWRVSLGAGDRITIDYEPVNGGRVGLYIFAPSVTDFTFGSSSSIASGSSYGKSEFIWTAIGQGSWILDVHADYGYQLTATVTRAGFTPSAGGGSIASAPELPIGMTIVGGANAVDGREFWRVGLAAGDRLTIDYQPVNGGEVSLYVFNPTITDFTFGGASPVASGGSYDKSKFVWTATGQGSWILDVRADYGYQILASVQRVMTTRFSPSSGRRGSVVTISGRGFGASRGTSYVQFGSTKCAKYSSWSATRITCKVPAKAKFGKQKVTVVTPAGASNARPFTVKR